MPNLLANEKSPYLLQHAGNPVNWYPWGEAAFAEARRAGKPIFLSVGYSTCHWCHVMERESFEDAQVAAVLNEHFVSIKVDREERPDIDRVYMTFVQATTGSGGWPMSVWLTPDLRPFYGGTYFPPRPAHGRPGFRDLLAEIARAWREDRPGVVRSAAVMTERLRAVTQSSSGGNVPGAEVLQAAVRDYGLAFDARHGGFGRAPKFPRPAELLFLLREHARTGDGHARAMVEQTLRAVALGGMRDHVGGGFHRYSVDAEWRVPHFEKMLYDQAQLVIAYLEAAQLTGDDFFAAVAADTLDYVRCDMTAPAGGFYSAEDADSLPPGAAADGHKVEGAFYTWENQEIGRVLGEDADVFRLRFGIRPEGNAPFDPQGEFHRMNLLYMARPVEEVARLVDASVAEVDASLARARSVLFRARQRRPRPHLDDKILAAWNGLMIGAFARGARVIAALRPGPAGETLRNRYVDSARRAASFVRSRMWSDADGLWRRHRDGESAIGAYAEDYASMTFGLIELFQADGDPAWLEWAIELQARQDRLFWDEVDGGWFSTVVDEASVLLRLKEEHDGAEPSASALSVCNLIVLDRLIGDRRFEDRIAATLRLFAPKLESMPRALPMMLAALSAHRADPQQVVIAGDRRSADTQALSAVVDRVFLPFAARVPVEPGAQQERLGRLIPAVAAMTLRGGRATAYVCRDFACQAPTTDPAELEAQLSSLSSRSRR